MKPNRSVPAPMVTPVLDLCRVRGAVAWLSAAFGFAERVRIGEKHRLQPRFEDGAVIVGDVRGDRRPSRPDELRIPFWCGWRARAHCERAREHSQNCI